METNLQQIQLEAYRLSEKSLESELTTSLAADQRALNFCGLVVAAAAILTGLYDTDAPNNGLLFAALILIVAAILAGIAARPVQFYAPGSKFSNFEPDINANVNYYGVIVEIGTYNDKHSTHNRKVMRENSNLLLLSFMVAVVGLVFAVLSQIVL